MGPSLQKQPHELLMPSENPSRVHEVFLHIPRCSQLWSEFSVGAAQSLCFVATPTGRVVADDLDGVVEPRGSAVELDDPALVVVPRGRVNSGGNGARGELRQQQVFVRRQTACSNRDKSRHTSRTCQSSPNKFDDSSNTAPLKQN